MQTHTAKGYWSMADEIPETGPKAIHAALLQTSLPIYIVKKKDDLAAVQSGCAHIGHQGEPSKNRFPLLAYAPPLAPRDLGDKGFKRDHHLTYAYICGAMANGITSVEMVKAAGNAGMVGFFGAGGLSLPQIETAIGQLKPKHFTYGFNLIHSPSDMELERKTVELYLDKKIQLISASAYLDLTAPLVYYRLKGIHRNQNGRIVCPNKVIAKVSRVEVAGKFFSPAPEKHVRALLEQNLITAEEAALSQHIPMAQDLSAEADSGGHTDNRPALALLPTMMALKDEMAQLYPDDIQLRVGLGGGIATPFSAAAAFSMGAAYILTGSINQSCVEADTCDAVRKMLAEAGQADVIMAPAADMFEMGVKVQVLKRGTMFSMRASKLYDLYTRYDSFEQIPDKQKELVESAFLRASFEKEWENTRAFFLTRDPSQVTRAEKDPKHKMALVFRSYLGRASLWAKTGVPDRRIDYQIWCGPAMGAFNEWVKNSFLEQPENRKTANVAMNLLLGACVVTRAGWLKNQGIELPSGIGKYTPFTDRELSGYCGYSPF